MPPITASEILGRNLCDIADPVSVILSDVINAQARRRST
jgi:hypothetical protein